MVDNDFFEKIMELGIGISVARQMPNFLSQCLPESNMNGQPTPPQVTADTSYFLVVDNVQAGPFKESDLLLMAKNNLISSDTLVWKSGMPDWLPACHVPEINKLLILSKIAQR